MSIRICMVGYAEYPYDVRIRREVESLVRRGMNVDIICLRRASQKLFDLVDSVHIYRLPFKKDRTFGFARYVLSYMTFFLLAGVVLCMLHVRRRYNIIQFHTLPDFIIFAGLIPKLFGAKLLLDMHEVTPEFYMTKFKAGPSHPMVKLARFIEKISVRFADWVIVVTDPIAGLI